MKIGILGSAVVAKVMGAGLIGLGHEVKLGSREPSKLREWVKENGAKASAGSPGEAAAFGEVLFLCMKGEAAVDVVRQAGIENFAGKTVVDVTNPLVPSPQGIALSTSAGDSLAERIQKVIPEAKVVKAFNTVSAYIMVNPRLEEGLATLTIFGDDEPAKAQVTDIAKAFGWDVVDLGGLNLAYWNEAQAMIWCLYGFKFNHWTHAFQLLRK
jgi:predicted dinucleotide-binding enzyme